MRSHLDKGRFALRPVVKSRGVEIRSVRPHQRACLRIERNLVEQTRIAQRAVQFAPQDWLEIDDPFRSVVKYDAQGVRSDDPEFRDAAHQVRTRQVLDTITLILADR